MEMWLGDFCPKCKSHNLFYNGHDDDSTGCDIDGGICWKCKHQWVFPEIDEPSDFPYYVEGKKLDENNH